MEKFKTKIMEADFPRLFKRFFAAALAALMLTGAASAALLQTQISELAAYKSTHERSAPEVLNLEEQRDAQEKAAFTSEAKKDNQTALTREDGKNGKAALATEEEKDSKTALSREDKKALKAAHKKEREEKHLAALLTPPTPAAWTALAAFALTLAASALTYWLLSAAWLSQAAARSGLSGSLWLAAGLIGNIAAAALFFAARRALYKKCLQCGEYHFLRYKFCKCCGAPLTKECPVCGKRCALDTHYCQGCGREL